MGVWDDYECEGQLSIFDMVQEEKPAPKEPECFADYVGRCEYCDRSRDGQKSCWWWYKNDERRGDLMRCGEKHNMWMPSSRIPNLCGSCKYSNCFHYEGESIWKPIETEDLYCTHPDGPLNRTQPYAEYEEGINGAPGLWHRQYEYRTCARWAK